MRDNENTYGIHPQHFYQLGSPATGYEECMWIVNIYYVVPENLKKGE